MHVCAFKAGADEASMAGREATTGSTTVRERRSKKRFRFGKRSGEAFPLPQHLGDCCFVSPFTARRIGFAKRRLRMGNVNR
jgi:hypothetical protein